MYLSIYIYIYMYIGHPISCDASQHFPFGRCRQFFPSKVGGRPAWPRDQALSDMDG